MVPSFKSDVLNVFELAQPVCSPLHRHNDAPYLMTNAIIGKESFQHCIVNATLNSVCYCL